MDSRLLPRAAVVLAATVATVFVAGPAFAHVAVDPSQSSQGGDAKLAFTVPNEKDNADTVKLQINLPTDTPIASVATKPVAGWTVETATTKLDKPLKTDDGEVTEAISTITWTAGAGAGIKPGQFQEFDISAGPLPNTDKIIFKVLQTYSDGEVVRWIDPPAASGPEPEHPAPVLTLAKSSAGDTSSSPADTTTAAGKSSSDNGTAGTALVLGIAGLVAGLAALVVALLGYRRSATAGT